ncbi:MAG: kinase to dihydroxyacetone kinase [Clostridium sp.]|uniref:kinase to dihydroxyacetone kinase n=1 Tax=Clostridium TaxID=1485 RepID=UPI001158CB73|nr:MULTISPECIES: kinase to dihydroxyacetone kinase [Clostridium]MDB1933079.1 kinase to dihydroxyacetone kinase [Clostridium tertium]MDB1938887.1 kinase to dihydroxyacetone kinase [Clostridium tertium]MDU7147469.1 kinase to dihydroxyacetone kinase [Clostridium sp.]
MLEYKFDTQLLIDGHDLSEDAINEYITKNIEGDCLLAVGDEDLIKVHFHTNTPWKLLEYCDSLGDIYDVVIENMERQENGLQG